MPSLLRARCFIQIKIKLLHYNYSSIIPAFNSALQQKITVIWIMM